MMLMMMMMMMMIAFSEFGRYDHLLLHQQLSLLCVQLWGHLSPLWLLVVVLMVIRLPFQESFDP